MGVSVQTKRGGEVFFVNGKVRNPENHYIYKGVNIDPFIQSLNITLKKFYSYKKMPLEITLSPEFGWSIKNEPVYGPGSVFQGKVTLHNSSRSIH